MTDLPHLPATPVWDNPTFPTSDGEFACEECGGAVDVDGDTKGHCAANGGPKDPCPSCYACSCDGSC